MLGQTPVGDPVLKEQFEVVESGAQSGAQALDLGGEVAGPGRNIRCHNENITYTVVLTAMRAFSS